MNRLAKWMMRLYPAPWRARYGDELDALLADSGADARVVADLFQGGVRMRFSTWTFPKLALGLGIGGVLVGLGISLLGTPVYESKATLQITPWPVGQASPAVQPQLIETILQMKTAVLSRTSLSGIINNPRLQLYADDRRTKPLEDVIEKMKTHIGINVIPAGRRTAAAFEVSFSNTDRIKALQTVQALVDEFDRQILKNQVSWQMARNSPGAQSPQLEVALDVLHPASLPVEPVKPNRYKIAWTGFMAGIISAGIIATIRGARNRRPISTLMPTA